MVSRRVSLTPASCLPIPSGTSGAHNKDSGGCAYDGTCASQQDEITSASMAGSVSLTLSTWGNAQWVDVAGINAGSYV